MSVEFVLVVLGANAVAAGIGAVLGFPAGWLAAGQWSRHHGRKPA